MDDPVNAGMQVWIDKHELAELVAELSSAVDRGDRERIVSCYAEGSFDDHGGFKGSGRAFAEFVCGPGAMSRMHHLLGQSVFDVRGDEAWGETFFVFHGAAGTTAVSGCGRYVDYFRKSDGRWKVSYRRVVPDEVPVGDDLAAYWPASRDRSDPSYDRKRAPDDIDPGE
ncbi:MAG TPA: nuclear transport factor 2 family protein [Acidimicrobiales bacterium]|nr:nuclear transport factor 2 family protein [Acidimicrobiales bacterium]